MNGLVVVGNLLLEGGDYGFAEVDAFDGGVVLLLEIITERIKRVLGGVEVVVVVVVGQGGVELISISIILVGIGIPSFAVLSILFGRQFWRLVLRNRVLVNISGWNEHLSIFC